MKTLKMIRGTFFTILLLAFTMIGCEKLETYSIDAPADLQSRIDSIAAAKASKSTGDTVYVDIATAMIGDEDNTAAWWTAFSDYFTIPTNKLLHLEFVNNGTGENNWNNWNLAVTNEIADRDAADYKEYFVLRSDAFGWGGKMDDEGYAYDAAMIQFDFPDVDGDGDIWNDFRANMQGATVYMDIDHSATGNVFVTAKAIATNGVEMVLNYQQAVSTTKDITAFLVADGSHFIMKEAYLIPSKVTEVEDVLPTSIVVEGTPEFVEFGSEDYWGTAVATVTFADGSSTEVAVEDLSFTVIPDMSTTGEKTAIVSYNKTKQGEFCAAVSTLYTFEITNNVSSIEITKVPDITEYYFFGTDPIRFSPQGMEVTATYADGSTGILPNTVLTFGEISATEGPQDVTITYEGSTSKVSTTCSVTLTKGITQIGFNDFSTPWWSEFSADYPVAAGESKTITMYCYSNNLQNYHSPCTILRNTDLAEFAVVRMDNYGWGDGYGTATVTSNWDFDTFASNINGSKIVLTVTNNGDDTADVHYDVTYANGEAHFQTYEGISVDSADLNFAIVLEGSYIVLTEE